MTPDCSSAFAYTWQCSMFVDVRPWAVDHRAPLAGRGRGAWQRWTGLASHPKRESMV